MVEREDEIERLRAALATAEVRADQAEAEVGRAKAVLRSTMSCQEAEHPTAKQARSDAMGATMDR